MSKFVIVGGFLFSMSKSKYDNAYKQEALLKRYDKKVAELRRNTYKETKCMGVVAPDGEISSYYFRNLWTELYAPYREGHNFFDCAVRINESKQRKAKVVRDKINALVLSHNAIFITLTFNDRTMTKTDTEKRRRLVQRYLKANCKEYVANIDFGKLNGREHYHAIVSKELNLSNWFKYGSIDVERVKPFEECSSRVARYITKLTNHALKVGAVAPRLIYSRNTI